MANSNKVTIASTLRFVIDNCADKLSAEMLEKLNSMLAQTEKKSANRKSKAASETDIAICDTIVSVLSDKGMTATEIHRADASLTDFSFQKINAMLSKLTESGTIHREVVKGKALFTLA